MTRDRRAARARRRLARSDRDPAPALHEPDPPLNPPVVDHEQERCGGRGATAAVHQDDEHRAVGSRSLTCICSSGKRLARHVRRFCRTPMTAATAAMAARPRTTVSSDTSSPHAYTASRSAGRRRQWVNTAPGRTALAKHPRALQHRLVMESVLGRRLEPGESVHPENGMRHDKPSGEPGAGPKPARVRTTSD